MEVQRVFGRSPWSLSGAVDPSRFAETARLIAESVQEHAVLARDHTPIWRHPAEPVGPIRPAPLGPHLYSGTVGIAWFLAAASQVLTAAGDLRELALKALSPLRREIHTLADNPLRSRTVFQPVGGLAGLGSLVYGLTRIGDLLDDSSLSEDAHAVAALITPERISCDEALDVMVGCAGAILALLALDERQPGRTQNGMTPLEIASACAAHLLRKDASKLRSGFCHGREGLSTALLRLCQRTGSPKCLEAVRNMDDPGPATFASSWCKGAPGIALFLLERGEGAEAELATTACQPLSETDDLCCGNAGRIDVLLYASTRRDDAAFVDAASRVAEGVLERAEMNGSLSLKLSGQSITDVRLFNGLAGVGYGMLRLLAPDRIPCVLAME